MQNPINYTKRDILNYLQSLGWTELIDARWERQVIRDMGEGFPDASPELVEEVLNVVLVKDLGKV